MIYIKSFLLFLEFNMVMSPLTIMKPLPTSIAPPMTIPTARAVILFMAFSFISYHTVVYLYL